MLGIHFCRWLLLYKRKIIGKLLIIQLIMLIQNGILVLPCKDQTRVWYDSDVKKYNNIMGIMEM